MYCTSCVFCCPLCGDPELESCASCSDEPAEGSEFPAMAGLIVACLMLADLYKRSAHA